MPVILSRRAIASMLGALCVAPAFAQAPDPAAPVRTLYAAYGVGDSGGRGLGDRQAKALFSKALFALYRRAAKAGLDDDFFVQGQDFNLAKPIEIMKVETTGDRAHVSATLTQKDADANGKPKERIDQFQFTLVREDGGWKIDDAVHGKDSVRKAWQATIRAGGVR